MSSPPRPSELPSRGRPPARASRHRRARRPAGPASGRGRGRCERCSSSLELREEPQVLREQEDWRVARVHYTLAPPSGRVMLSKHTSCILSVAASLATLLCTTLAQCSGPECCTAEEVARHQCTGPCYNIAGEPQPCLAAESTCTQCMAGVAPAIPAGQNFQMSCTGTPSDTPVSFASTRGRAPQRWLSLTALRLN